jgi:hypothetical protein
MHPSTCYWFYNSYLLCASWALNINPLYSLTLTKTQRLPWCSYWHNRNQQQLFTSASFWFYTIYHRCNPKTIDMSFFAFQLPFLFSSNRILPQSPLHAWSMLGHPSFTTNMFHITHKQQSFLLTTTNKQWRYKLRYLHEEGWQLLKTNPKP